MTYQTDPAFLRWIPFVFPFFFIALWLFIGTGLGLMSGWFSLQRGFPKGSGEPLQTFRMKSGSMGSFGFGGVNMNGILNLSPTAEGLRVGVFRLFGIFQRPFEVPWREIRVERRTMLFLPRARLTFGTDEGNLSLSVGLWNRIVAFAPERDRARLKLEPVAASAMASGLLAAWVVLTVLFGTFIAMTSRTGPHPAPVPAAIAYAMPALVLGIAFVSLWVREVR